MRTYQYILLVVVSFLVSCSESDIKPDFINDGTYDGEYFPTYEWRYCSPEDVGVNSKNLIEARTLIADPNAGTDGYLVIKNGYIIAEEYFNSFSGDKKHASFSIAKSFTSAVIGIAIDKAYISSVDDKFSDYIEELGHDSIQQWKKELKVSQVLTMTSGLDWSEEGVSGNDLFQLAQSENYVDYVLSKSIANEPGTIWSYNSGESMYLSGLINRTTGKSMLQFAEEHLLQAIGINDLTWTTDANNQTLAGWGINASIYDFARFGYLFLNNGNWDGNQVISEEWVAESTSSFSNEYTFYGYLWWIGNESYFENTTDLPDDIYMAIGAFGQYIIIIPSENLVIVRLGQELIGQDGWNPAEFIRLILKTV